MMRTMQKTKRQILDYLKRTGGATVDDLARALGLARITIRQHLMAMERDRLVNSREVRQRAGRPHYLFTLAEAGQETFPKRYERLALMLLEQVGSLSPQELEGLSPKEKRRLLLSRALEGEVRRYEGLVQGKELPERVEAVAQLLGQESGLAEWRRTENGFEIIDYNCLYHQVAQAHEEVCEWHLALLSRVLGHPVRCSQFMSRGAESCRFIIDLTRTEGSSNKDVASKGKATGGQAHGRPEQGRGRRH
ncbi:hypothetical protein HRbin25_00829 [bacterium HR25]|jgi:predicted ArsR family transcriptional regulator|nr:hypothetical protein HRbin25_00829 [bacterium HR25]